VATHTMLTFAAMNLKKLATWLWKTKKPMAFYFKIMQRLTKRSGLITNSFLSTI
ncbi:TPA: IS5/IS1182 family transposase, partial [Enterococcus faecium]